MKHLKLYESDFQDTSWSKITTEEAPGMVNYFNFNKIVKFENSEWIRINSIFSIEYLSDTYQPSIYKVFDVRIDDKKSEIKLFFYSQSKLRSRFAIYKFPDEWFFVVDIKNSCFYKCDQLDGLINCLKSIF